MKPSCALRPAAESDLRAINAIYNHYVLHSTCTHQEEFEPLESRRQWFSHKVNAPHGRRASRKSKQFHEVSSIL
jgi:L-amino acid N-acyltransferase YncA